MSCYSIIYLLKLNIVGDFTKMNTETESEKSLAETTAAPLWKYVIKLEKASIGGEMLLSDVTIVKKLSRGLIQG